MAEASSSLDGHPLHHACPTLATRHLGTHPADIRHHIHGPIATAPPARDRPRDCEKRLYENQAGLTSHPRRLL